MRTVQITTRNARFQQWQALLTNRNKRQRAGEFLVQGVRPVTLALEHGWHTTALLYASGRRLSDWARDLLASGAPGERIAMAPELLAELSEREDADAELIAVVSMPPDDLSRIPVGPDFLGVLFDRPTSPGNIGSLLRSADAFGADGLIVTGHAADVYDPKSVRAGTGSLFALPTVRVPSPHAVTDWLSRAASKGHDVTVIGTDEHGDTPLFDADLTGPVLLLIGNETTGLSAAWRTACDRTVSIPMHGTASSLNAANAGTAVLYEAARQRH
ncbi:MULTISPECIES: RNA methyltransferase [unclassified Streptomyces]|uniref:RNA methyltransferase n=1 Tax=unclassified Streptomyces TaxID=2593676 RepID=UPI002DDA402B|nr:MULTISPECIES: RNA methyltransferase [unclassified Streptomyces]WSA95123.1 RNA methyltransferase [Streptomyces sp. NBC_01795]WSB79544.1 RNA methyltransferase [Streptomyces sp. NBC_01775]WSS12252.1 RNA methyltransferase [Streptomyces sp. NBC_01186]WSS40965.1 RNA methyltransferase [Streptomyces sp. NBC_01187]